MPYQSTSPKMMECVETWVRMAAIMHCVNGTPLRLVMIPHHQRWDGSRGALIQIVVRSARLAMAKANMDVVTLTDRASRARVEFRARRRNNRERLRGGCRRHYPAEQAVILR